MYIFVSLNIRIWFNFSVVCMCVCTHILGHHYVGLGACSKKINNMCVSFAIQY